LPGGGPGRLHAAAVVAGDEADDGPVGGVVGELSNALSRMEPGATICPLRPSARQNGSS